MNAGISEIDGQEQAVARLNEIVEELPIVEQRNSRNDLLLPENHSIVSRCILENKKTNLFSSLFQVFKEHWELK